MEKHTFLFDESNWNVNGIFIDKDESSYVVEGVINIFHNEAETKVTQEIVSRNLTGKRIYAECILERIKENKRGFSFVKKILDLADLKGSLLISEDNLISVYESEDKKFSGSEYYKKITDDYYKNRGMLFYENNKHSSWSLELRRLKND